MNEEDRPPRSASDSVGNGWNEHRIAVRSDLRRHEGHFRRIFDRLEALDRRVTVVEVKAGLWGAGAGVLTVLGYILIQFLTNRP